MAVKREQVVQTAEKYVARGKIEPAIREYRKLLEENPNDINTLNRVGDLYARIQRIDEAVDFFNQIAEQYAGEGFFVKAIAIYKKIIKLDPTRLDVYENLAELYHRQGLVTEARTQYQVLADYYQKHENATSTIAIYQKMAELEPSNPTYHVKLAELYQQQQLIEKAMGEYRIIAELMITHGHPHEAAQVYERALAIDSTNLAFITDAALKLKEAAGAAIAARFLAAAVERNPQAAQVARIIGGGAAAAAPVAVAGPAGDASATAPPPEPPPPAPAPARGPLPPPAGARGGRLEPDHDEDMEIEIDLGSDLVLDAPPVARQDSPGARQASPAAAADEEPSARFGMAAGFDPAFEIEEEAGAPGVPGTPSGTAAERRPPAARDTGEVDLGDVFVLDIEDEEEPASLVKPPPDMLHEPRRPSWAQEAAPPPQPPSQPPPRLYQPLPQSPRTPPAPAALAPTAGAAGAPATPASATPPAPPAAPEPADFRLTGTFELINPFAALIEPAAVGEPLDPWLSPLPEELPPLPEALTPLQEALPPLPETLSPQPEAPPAPVPETAPAAAEAAASATPPPAPADGQPPALHIDSDLLERTAAELHRPPVERYEDLVSEAEVLAKYGLEEKAIERLREAVRLRPRQFAAYLLLIQLLMDKGRHGRVVELANEVARLSESGDREPWAKLRRRLLAAGYRLDGDRIAAGPQPAGGIARPRTPKAAAPGAAPDAPPVPAAGPAALTEPAAAPPAVPAAADLPEPPAAPAPTAAAASRRQRKAPDTDIQRLLHGLVDRPARAGRPAKKSTPAAEAAPAAPDLAALPPTAAAAAAAGPALVPTPEAPAIPPAMPPAGAVEPVALPAAGPEIEPPPVPAAPVPELLELPPLLEAGRMSEPPAEEIFNPLEIGAMVESEAIDWDDDGTSDHGFGAAAAAKIDFGGVGGAGAGPPLASPLASAGGAALPPVSGTGGAAPPAVSGTATGAGAAGPPPRPASPAAAAASLDDTGGMSWLDEADSGKHKIAAGAASLFDEEEDFFDLAGELERDLSQEPVFQGGEPLAPQEQSLEEIVEGFKRGVAEHLSPTDYDTHFNLGIAYREMGLLDEAIGEFQLSAKDSRYLVSCCSMLGLCFLDKGLPELAIKWYRRGLEAEAIGEEDTLGLLYDMGCAHLAMGDQAGAYKTFVEAYGINTNYRDLVARIEELGRPR